VQCIVHVFLETFAHKSHRYVSRYPEIFEKKSRLIVRKIRYIVMLLSYVGQQMMSRILQGVWKMFHYILVDKEVSVCYVITHRLLCFISL